jgi:hypothetical protein
VGAVLFVAALVASAFMYAAFFGFLFVEGTIAIKVPNEYGRIVDTWKLTEWQKIWLTAGGALALVAVLLPILTALPRLRPRRIWALARLSMKETIRHRVLWVFSMLLLVVLFASWFIGSEDTKPEDQLKTYIRVVDSCTTLLLLIAASLLASFSIPADVRSQTIHTVVTKPVERFEIVLGRFVGFLLLMTAVLAVATALGLVYVFRNINEEAKQENYKARVPVYGAITFKNTQGINVGREWTHRKYISGPQHRGAAATQYAIWSFPDVPARFADREGGVACEFGFDVYRTHKGEEGKGIFCTFLFMTPQCQRRLDQAQLGVWQKYPPVDERYRRAIEQQEKVLAKDTLSRFARDDRLAEGFGYYFRTVQVTDYHTQSITLPPGLFKNMAREDGRADTADSSEAELPPAPLRVYVRVDKESPAQLVGVARHDLYLLDQERPFELNYFKAAVGIWYRLCLMIGIGVAISTYLSGIITWIATCFLFGLGLFRDDIQKLAQGLAGGDGPNVSAIKLFTRTVSAAQLEDRPFNQAAGFLDNVFWWLMDQFIKVVPDVHRHDLSPYVLNGFDIPGLTVLGLDTLVPLVGYLVPWLIVSYYLINSREVANPS